MAVFDDRVEVENPGIPLPGLTIEELREGLSRVRNRILARVFNELGLIEQWGTAAPLPLRSTSDFRRGPRSIGLGSSQSED